MTLPIFEALPAFTQAALAGPAVAGAETKTAILDTLNLKTPTKDAVSAVAEPDVPIAKPTKPIGPQQRPSMDSIVVGLRDKRVELEQSVKPPAPTAAPGGFSLSDALGGFVKKAGGFFAQNFPDFDIPEDASTLDKFKAIQQGFAENAGEIEAMFDKEQSESLIPAAPAGSTRVRAIQPTRISI